MAKKHVEDYYLKMVSDYTEMKNTLNELQKHISEDNASKAVNQIGQLKEQVRLLEANYKRLSYIMYLLNMPVNKGKAKRYENREVKKLNDIPECHRKSAVEGENKEILSELKSYL